jgi:transposase
MKTSEDIGNLKRTKKDYSISFKLQLVKEVELGFLKKSQAKLKYGIQGDSTVTKW